MAKISIFIKDSYKKKDGTSAIYLRVFLNGKYKKINLDLDIVPEKFYKEKQLTTDKNINLQIKTAVGLASDIILKYKVNNKRLTHELFISEFKNPTSTGDFYDFMEKSIKERVGIIASNTIRSQLSVLSKMKGFKKTLQISELDDVFLQNFVKHLKRKKNKRNTIFEALKTIKIYVK